MVIQCIVESTLHHNVQPHFISVPYDDVENEVCYLLKKNTRSRNNSPLLDFVQTKTICLQILGPLAMSVAIFSNTWV